MENDSIDGAEVPKKLKEFVSNEAALLDKYSTAATVDIIVGCMLFVICMLSLLSHTNWRSAWEIVSAFVGGIFVGAGVILRIGVLYWPALRKFVDLEAIKNAP